MIVSKNAKIEKGIINELAITIENIKNSSITEIVDFKPGEYTVFLKHNTVLILIPKSKTDFERIDYSKLVAKNESVISYDLYLGKRDLLEIKKNIIQYFNFFYQEIVKELFTDKTKTNRIIVSLVYRNLISIDYIKNENTLYNLILEDVRIVDYKKILTILKRDSKISNDILQNLLINYGQNDKVQRFVKAVEEDLNKFKKKG